MLLVAAPIEVGHRPERAVVLEPDRHLRRDAVADLGGGGELEAPVDVVSLDRPLEGRVERDVPARPLLVDDRPQLDRPRVGGEGPALVADLGREAQADRQLPALGRAHARADVAAHPLPRGVGLDRGEHVEAGLEPRGEAVGDLEGLVEGPLRPEHAVLGADRAVRGHVAVQLHHGGAGGECLRAVDLDLEVLLGHRGRDRAQQAQGQAGQRAASPGSHGSSLRRCPIETNPVLV